MNSRVRPTVPRQTGVGRNVGLTSGSTRSTGPNFSSPGSPKRAPASRDSGHSPTSGRTPSSQISSAQKSQARPLYDEDGLSNQQYMGSSGIPRSSPHGTEQALCTPEEERGLFTVIEHLATLEAALWSILDGLKSNASYVSYFCREYWGTSASQAQLALEKLAWNERLKRQVQQACVLESLSLGVASNLCSGTMQDVSLTILSRLRNLLYYIHENCLVLLDLVCQRWLQENPNGQIDADKAGHCPENLNLDILIRTNRYRQLRKGEHVMALRQHNEMIANVVRQLCRGATLRRPPPTTNSRTRGSASPPPGDRSLRGAASRTGGLGKAPQGNILAAVNEILGARTPLDRLRASTIRSKMLQYICFRPLLNDGSDPDCLWPTQDPYDRYGSQQFCPDGPTIWFEPLPPMLCDLRQNPKLPPPANPEMYTLVLDLDETLVHYFEIEGTGNYGIRPGMHEFLQRMSAVPYELVIFTAATQDYADWVIDQIDPDHLVTHRLYRQHALPWGPLFAKDLSRLGRDLDRTLIIDNVQENFMLQPNNGIFILPWYEDQHDTSLFTLTPLLEELVQTRSRVPDILDKYRDQIPTWAGFDQFSQMGGDYDYEGPDEYALPPPPTQQDYAAQAERPVAQPDYQAPQRNEVRQPATAPMYASLPARAEAPQYMAATQPQSAQPQYEAASPYVGGFMPQAANQTHYLQQGGGYPQAQSQAAAPQRAAPRNDLQPKAAPTFSKVAGPYQAQPPQQAQPSQPQTAQAMTQATRPASAAMWGRPGLGAHQYVPPRQ